MALYDLGPMLHDVAQSDEATLSDACVLWRKALPHMLPYPLKVGMRSLSHGITNPGLYCMKGICRLTSS